VVGCIGIIKPVAAGVLAGLRVDLRFVGADAFQRRQTTGQVPPQCESLCNPINALAANCTLSQCCLATFDTGYFNCFVCVGTAANVTDYSVPQSIVDKLYDQCAIAGYQLPVLTFPGQNSTRPLSSVVLPSSSLTIVSVVSFTPSSVIQSVGPATATTSTQASIPTPSLSSGIRCVETSYFNLFAMAMVAMVLFCLNWSPPSLMSWFLCWYLVSNRLECDILWLYVVPVLFILYSTRNSKHQAKENFRGWVHFFICSLIITQS